MEYTIKANSLSKNSGFIYIKQSEVEFGIVSESAKILANPAEILLGALSSCILKNVERFSTFMHFDYSSADIIITATRVDKPPRMDKINYELTIYREDSNLNINLLKKNIEKFGTIFNTLNASCQISGEIKVISKK